MPTKYLSSYYSYKFVPRPARFTDPDNPAMSSTTSNTTERLVQARLTQGNELFFQGQYREALQQYLTAYGLLYRYFNPSIPEAYGPLIAVQLSSVNILDGVLSAAVQTARFRAIASSMTVVSAIDPPPQFQRLLDTIGIAGTQNRMSPAEGFYNQAVGLLEIGALAEAEVLLTRARDVVGRDQALDADISAATAIVAFRRNDRTLARQQLERASSLYRDMNRPEELAAVTNNLGVLHSLDGNAEAANAAFRAAADQLPVNLGRVVTQPLAGGAALVMQRPMGREGLSLLSRSKASPSGWTTISSGPASTTTATRLGVFRGDRVVDVDLQGDAIGNLRRMIYEPRIAANSLAALFTYEQFPFNFVSYLGHVYSFTLPIAIGDCYFEMGEFSQALTWYQRARDYQYLNLLIEAPLVWEKMAKTNLGWANFLFRSGDVATARARYETIVRINPLAVDPASPLYNVPAFNGMRAQVEAILAAPRPLNPDAFNPAISSLVLLAQMNIENIAAGIGFPLLSLQREQVPVFTFEYLQNVARYFAEHAIQAERAYINFKNSAEQEEFTRSMLENTVDLERANEALEAQKVQIAQQQLNTMNQNLAYANLQAANTQASRNQYANVSLQQNALDAEITYIGAPTTEYDFSGYSQYGIPDGTRRVDEVLRTLTERRREITRQFELDQMDRRIAEMQQAAQVAAAQQAIAQAQLAAAQAQQQITTLRRQQAEQQLALFDSQEFTPDLWNRLANAIKGIAQSYLQQAIVIAQLMEQSFEFEIGSAVDIIKPNYVRNDLSGLLGGDFLLRDIDSFTFLRIVYAEKKQPMKEVISLADRYPLQFLREFQRTGRMEFRTDLADFDRNYPGSHSQRIKRVEVIVEGLVGRGGLHGTLTNTGLCMTRTVDGRIRMRLLKPETLLLSKYQIGPDSIVFRPDAEMLAIFENSPVCTSWILELRPTVNDLIYNFITDVKLVVYYESFYSENLRQPVLEELAETQPISGRRSVALRYDLFDEFFAFQDTGRIQFTMRNTMLPFTHLNAAITDLVVLVETDEGVSPAGLVVEVTSAGTNATATTDAGGTISTGAASPLNAFSGRPLLGDWTISIPRAPNQARFDAGFQWVQVRNIVLVAEYGFTPPRITGEPFVVIRDNFAANTFASFQVVNDPQANQNAPSTWSYNTANRRIDQTSNIFGGPVDNGPVKNGTYLLRRTSATFPVERDFLLHCRVGSQSGGGIGMVFRWVDVNNFYYFLMDSQLGYRRIGKKVAGVFQNLTTPAMDLAHGYTAGNASYRLRIRMQGPNIAAYLDGNLILSGADASLANAGRVGMFCWRNQTARFDDFQVTEI
jgi:tetratricopeptide (TPR) repeat protein